MSKTLRLILGDQLSHDISSLQDANVKNDIILMCEVWDEATYVKHHKKKIAFLFSAMRHFAIELEDKSFTVDYIKLEDKSNTQSFKGEVQRAIKKHNIDEIIVTFPGEYRVWNDMMTWSDDFDCSVEIREDDRFLCSPEEFMEWAQDRKTLRMEYFYREMRKKHNILMDDNGKPVGGEWNYDSENRKPPKEGLEVPAPYIARMDKITQDCIDLVAKTI